MRNSLQNGLGLGEAFKWFLLFKVYLFPITLAHPKCIHMCTYAALALLATLGPISPKHPHP
jgi:polyferredoxin